MQGWYSCFFGMLVHRWRSASASSGGAVTHRDWPPVTHGQVLRDPPLEMASICSGEDEEAGWKVVPPQSPLIAATAPLMCSLVPPLSIPGDPKRAALHPDPWCLQDVPSSSRQHCALPLCPRCPHLPLAFVPNMYGSEDGGIWSPPGLPQGCCPLPASQTSWLSNPWSTGPEESTLQGSFLPRGVFKSSPRAKVMLLNDRSMSWDEGKGTARMSPSQSRRDGGLLPPQTCSDAGACSCQATSRLFFLLNCKAG